MGRIGDRFNRRHLLRSSLAVAGLGLLGCSAFPSQAPQSARLPRIGYLLAGALTPDSPFREGLRELGYVEGETIAIEWRADEGRVERRGELATELVRLGVDAIITPGDGRAQAVRAVTSTVPIILAPGNDPVGAGLAESFARPGGNVTGLVLAPPTQLAGKRLELLKETVPDILRVAVLAHAADPGSAAELRETERAAPALGLEIVRLAVQGPDDFEAVLAGATAEHPEGLVTKHSGFIQQHQSRVFEFAAQQRLPAIYGDRSYVAAGGLMAYGTDLAGLFRRTAIYVDKILKGAKPSELPIEQPARFDFAINLKTVQALGLVIPPVVLQQATEIIQ